MVKIEYKLNSRLKVVPKITTKAAAMAMPKTKCKENIQAHLQ